MRERSPERLRRLAWLAALSLGAFALVASGCGTGDPAGAGVIDVGHGGSGAAGSGETNAASGVGGNPASTAASATTATSGTGGGGCTPPEQACGAACVDLETDPTHCGDCSVACPPGETCEAGACVLDCGPSASACDSACVDTQVDPAHCGGCDMPCGAGHPCVAGACSLACAPGMASCNGTCTDLLTDPTSCGACDVACPAGEVCSNGACAASCQAGLSLCGGLCISPLSDLGNCGGCGVACAAGDVCSNGVCALSCGAGLSPCNGTCKDFLTDVQSCGACGAVCSPGQVCSSGICSLSCQAGFSTCSGACVNLQSDLGNCGGCGVLCGAGQVCSNGGCALSCQAGLTLCNGTCVDTQTSFQSCGACNTPCGVGQSCQLGACVNLPATNDDCATAATLTLGAGTTTLTGSTAGATPSAGSCDAGNDVFYNLVLTQRQLVYIDSFGSSFDTVLGVQSSCGAALTCVDDACGVSASQFVKVLPAGTHILHVDGKSGASGPFALRIQRIPVSPTPSPGTIPQGAFSFSGTTVGAFNNVAPCGATGPEQWYWWASCPNDPAGSLSASTCGAANYDTTLALRNGGGQSGCNDNACGIESSINVVVGAGAGLHVLYVDGANGASGTFTVTGNRP